MRTNVVLPFKSLTVPAQPWVLNRLWDTIAKVEEDIGRPNRFRACVWGSKRPKPPDPLYKAVFAMSRRLARQEIEIVTGGGPGVMEAANAGAKAGAKEVRASARLRTYGVRVSLRDEPPNPHLDTVFHRSSFCSRLHQFVMMSSAFIACDPGIGTVLEVLYVWQLLKEEHLENVPLILVGECWDGLLHWMDHGMIKKRRSQPRSQELPSLHRARNCREAIPIVLAARDRFYGSQRAA